MTLLAYINTHNKTDKKNIHTQMKIEGDTEMVVDMKGIEGGGLEQKICPTYTK